MPGNPIKRIILISTFVLPLIFSAAVLAQDPPSAAVEQGALAWNNWTKTDAGGSDSLPIDVQSADYIRCKGCHGWDRLGTKGGYVRRGRKDTRANAGFGDGDATPRAIPEAVTSAMILHDGTGRSFAEGQGSWVELNDMHQHHSNNKADHSAGYTQGNQHPDFSGGDLTQTQIDNLVAFLNFDDGAWSAYFAGIDPSVTPVLYSMIDTADATDGESFYNSNCFVCHGDPATDHQGLNDGHPGGGILSYLEGDGKFSELSHAARWGIPNTIMTRGTIGSPTSQNIADMMLYLQNTGGTGLAINSGHSGNWWNGLARAGEGFMIDVALNGDGDTIIVVSFYSYDSLRNQVFLFGSSAVIGNMVEITMTIPEGAKWGDDFDPADIPWPATEWGTGTFTFTSCSAGSVTLVPNMEMQNRGFTELSYDLNRELLIPNVKCPN